MPPQPLRPGSRKRICGKEQNQLAKSKHGVRPLTPNQKVVAKKELPKNITALAKGLKNLERVRSGLIQRELERLRRNPAKAKETIHRIRMIESKAGYLINARRIQMEGRAFRDLNFTELLNRPVFRQLAINRVRKLPEGGSLVLLDIDRFKKFNDEFGHKIGDLVISAYAKALKEQSNQRNGFAGRYGGEELLIWLPIKSQREVTQSLDALRPRAVEIARQLINELDEESVERKRLIEHFLPKFPAFSAGVVSFTKDHIYERRLSLADRLLYDAKEAGRNRVKYGDEEESKIRIVGRK